jgi:hypothetical protein
MIRALTIIAAVVALAVSASPASAASDPIPVESIGFNLKAGPPKPPSLGTPSGGEVISDFAKAQRTQPSVVVLIGANNYG